MKHQAFMLHPVTRRPLMSQPNNLFRTQVVLLSYHKNQIIIVNLWITFIFYFYLFTKAFAANLILLLYLVVRNISIPKIKIAASQNFQGKEKKVKIAGISGLIISALKGLFASSSNSARYFPTKKLRAKKLATEAGSHFNFSEISKENSTGNLRIFPGKIVLWGTSASPIFFPNQL